MNTGTGTLETSPAAVDAESFRRTLGHFPTGLAVITAVYEGEPVGMIANSFTAVSLEPPLVLFCPAHSSTTWPKIKASGGYSVNILSEESDLICTHFTSSGKRHLEGLSHGMTERGRPVLDDAITWLDCRIRHEYPGGDHAISVAEVEDMGAPGGAPMVFFQSAYQRLNPKPVRITDA